MTNPTITAEEIKARVDMPALVSYILEQEDREPIPEDRVIRCLLHEDRSPSMMVNEETCYCFACEKTWDIIQLVRDFYGLSFVETLSWFEEHIDELEDEVEVEVAKTAPPKVITSDPSTEKSWITGIHCCLNPIDAYLQRHVYSRTIRLINIELDGDQTLKPFQFLSGADSRGTHSLILFSFAAPKKARPSTGEHGNISA